MKVCYIEFEANLTQKYAYLCGNLSPSVGQWVVILVGKEPDKRKKIVRCVALGEGDDKATAFIFGLIQEQPQ